jgi:hypothetical protein
LADSTPRHADLRHFRRNPANQPPVAAGPNTSAHRSHYLLTEWILEAPQLLAKMSLKTNKEMPVHGADGVHVRFCEDAQQLRFYWGESKLYADVGQGITAAVSSVVAVT